MPTSEFRNKSETRIAKWERCYRLRCVQNVMLQMPLRKFENRCVRRGRPGKAVDSAHERERTSDSVFGTRNSDFYVGIRNSAFGLHEGYSENKYSRSVL